MKTYLFLKKQNINSYNVPFKTVIDDIILELSSSNTLP